MSNLLDLPASTMSEPLDVLAKWESSTPDEFLLEFLIHGVTAQGRPFRPSDWSERLCGVMSCFRPGGYAQGRDALIGYSPFVRPVSVGDTKCVLVDPAIREVEPMALDFVMNFARDNGLRVTLAQATVAT